MRKVIINDIAAFSNNITLVLDDYQTIQSSSLHQALAFPLGYQPAQPHYD
jgi:ATP/maltotriose-dependent transcriptional regulator MalT